MGDHLKVREPQVGLDRPWVRGISERQLWRAGEQISSTANSYGIWKLWSWGCRVEQNLEPPTWPSLLLDQTSDTHAMHTPQQHKPQFNWLSPILRITGSIQHSKTQKEDAHLFFSPIHMIPLFPLSPYTAFYKFFRLSFISLHIVYVLFPFAYAVSEFASVLFEELPRLDWPVTTSKRNGLGWWLRWEGPAHCGCYHL